LSPGQPAVIIERRHLATMTDLRMLKDYPRLMSLLQSGFSGDRDTFKQNLDLMLRRAEELGDDAVKELVAKVSEKGERGRFEDVSDLSKKKAAFDLKLGDVGDIPPGLLLLKTDATMDQVILPANVKQVLFDFIEEQTHNGKYLDAGLEPRNRAMLIGPPGNGKTQVTKAIANFMDVPLYFVRYDDLISVRQGETSKRLSEVFRFAKTHRCILFFDEIDAIGKDRTDESLSGEMKSVVSTLLVQVDSVPPHVMCLGATNYEHMIDKAMWRRFQIRVKLPNPGIDEFVKYLEMRFGKYGVKPNVKLRVLSYRLEAENFAEVEVFVDDCIRTWVRHDRLITIEEAVEKAVVMWPKTRVKIAKL
jgi:SpoVK/Ycf46/Vps4 family AAA+-type ATPase